MATRDMIDSAYAVERFKAPRRVPEFLYYLAAAALFAAVMTAPHWWPHLFPNLGVRP